jgi:Ras homolog gene family, member A
VTQAQGQAVATKMGAKYMECSSKEWIGVEEIFDTAIVDAVRMGEEMEARMRGEQIGSRDGQEGNSSGRGSKGGKRKKGSRSCRIL